MRFGMRGLAAVVVLSTLSCGSASAQNDGSFVNERDGFSIAISPAAWSQTAPTSAAMKWAAVKRDGTKTANVRALEDVGDIDFSSPEAQQAFEAEYLKSIDGVKVTSSDTTLDGRPAFRLITSGTTGGRRSLRVSIAVGANNRAYIVSGVSTVSDADTDAELNSILNTFHAIEVHRPGGSGGGGGWGLGGSTAGGVIFGAAVIKFCLRRVRRWAQSD